MDSDLYSKVDEALKINNGYCLQSCGDEPMFVVQPISTTIQETNSVERKAEIIAKNKLIRKRLAKKCSTANGSSVAEIYQGQSFPFRLWHLINDPNYDDVFHWSHDGNYIVFPDEKAFLLRVLLKQENRIFITTEMKSFVRQLNLYGFHKVQLEKDETFVYLRQKEKSLWPEAVFSHPFFKRSRPDLLESVKRRCRVKQQKLKNTIKSAQEMFQFYSIPMPQQAALVGSNQKKKVSYSQIMQPHLTSDLPSESYMESQFQNIIPEVNQQHQLDRRDAKRKLEFDMKDEVKPNVSVVPSPYYIYPQSFVNNYQMIPPGWTVSGNSASTNVPENITNCFDADDRRPLSNFMAGVNVDTSTTQQNEPNVLYEEEKERESLSPLAAFCASLFQPSSNKTKPSPHQVCEDQHQASTDK